MEIKEAYKDFTARFKLLIRKHPDLIITTLSNIFTMRLIGNKTHGDPAEIAIAEFINQYMYDFKSLHVGKDLYRAKSHEEDIKIVNEITKAEFPVSLKAMATGHCNSQLINIPECSPGWKRKETKSGIKAKLKEFSKTRRFLNSIKSMFYP
jgi:hypothetical protein